jgi:hypothetical protein
MVSDKDLGMKRWSKLLHDFKSAEIELGIFKSAGTNEGEYISDYAYENEHGTERIPARPFLGLTVDRKKDEWLRFLEDGIDRAVEEKNTKPDFYLARLGEKMVGDVKLTISSNMPPPNAEATIKRKKSSKTLIDTGAMRNAVTYRRSK